MTHILFYVIYCFSCSFRSESLRFCVSQYSGQQRRRNRMEYPEAFHRLWNLQVPQNRCPDLLKIPDPKVYPDLLKIPDLKALWSCFLRSMTNWTSSRKNCSPSPLPLFPLFW